MSVEETIVYELVLVRHTLSKILAIDNAGARCLPHVEIPRWTRPAEKLQKAIRAKYDLHTIVLRFFATQENRTRRALAQLLLPNTNSGLREVALEDIPGAFTDNDLESANVLGSQDALSQLGWIDEAITWVESATGRKLSSKIRIEQLNASWTFSLLRFEMEDGSRYWLKATGEPNAHELPITCLLSELCGDYLPQLISFSPSWNAWLMSGETTQVIEWSTDPSKLFRLLKGTIESMAELQMRTAGRHLELLNAGAFDQRIEVFERHSEAMFDYLEEAMNLQVSTKAPRISKARLQENRILFENVCRRMEDLDLPQTIVHGDLNPGNILAGSGQTKFIDWCEAYVGSPLIALHHLLRLNQVEDRGLRVQINQALKRRYQDSWAKAVDPVCLERGFPCMPALAIFSSLLGRGDWLTSPKRNDPRLQSYSRTLARHLDRALREPELMEALCH